MTNLVPRDVILGPDPGIHALGGGWILASGARMTHERGYLP
jgi:hypothetical protein